jgi:hypothetical protein
MRELDPRRKRKDFRPGFLFIGGGVSDSWQPGERQIELTRRVLELLKVFPYPLLVLTKSHLVLRDIDLLASLNEDNRVVVAVSLSTVDEKISGILEPGASNPEMRLEVVRRARAAGLGAGVMLLPAVPLLTDSSESLDAVYSAAAESGAQFVMAGPMTLKSGRQRNHFMQIMEDNFPEAAAGYDAVYPPSSDKWGNPSTAYYDFFSRVMHRVAGRYGLPRRIPPNLFPGNLTPTERVSVMLDQMHGLLRERGLRSDYGRASRSVAAMDVPLDSSDGWKHLRRLGGVGASTERMIKSILDTGDDPMYRRVLTGGA